MGTKCFSPVFVELNYICSKSKPRWETETNCLGRCFSFGQTPKRNDSVLRSELLLSGQWWKSNSIQKWQQQSGGIYLSELVWILFRHTRSSVIRTNMQTSSCNGAYNLQIFVSCYYGHHKSPNFPQVNIKWKMRFLRSQLLCNPERIPKILMIGNISLIPCHILNWFLCFVWIVSFLH